jgi:transglutaminase-like putative cysteine protease
MNAMVRYIIEHVSSYIYGRTVARSAMWLCLEPRSDFDQNVRHFEAKTEPSVLLSPETDAFGNNKHVITINFEHDTLEISTRSVVDNITATGLPTTLGPDAWEEIASWTDTFEHWDFTHESALTLNSPALKDFVARYRIGASSDPVESLLRLGDTLQRNFDYSPGTTAAGSTIEDILETKQGVCQDYAHVMIAIARSWGIPARYVSGYLHVTGLHGEVVPASATHAWVECLLPDLGWFGFDPTNATVADERHVRIAVGRDYLDVSPTRGILIAGEPLTLEATVKMQEVPFSTS